MFQPLPSRKISAGKFLQEFISTLTPGVIPRANFIQWASIEHKIQTHRAALDFFAGLHGQKGSRLVQELADCLQSADNPSELLYGAFELLGHTGDEFVSLEDAVHIKELGGRISSDGETTAKHAAHLLHDLGLEKILASKDIRDTFLGVQVGLETHRRKNVGGQAFNSLVATFLDSMVKDLRRAGLDAKLQPELRILYKDGTTSKRVDFGLLVKGTPRVGIEVNFYTGPGSKPTEIKRSYTEVNRRLADVGVVLIWITDGNGYQKMRKSLHEAFEAHPNIYNFEMTKKHLKGDLLTTFG